MMCFSCRVTSDAKVVFLDVIPTPQDIISDFSYICLLLTIKFEYMENISRRTAIKTFLAGGVALDVYERQIRGLHRVRGRILEKCDASHPV